MLAQILLEHERSAAEFANMLFVPSVTKHMSTQREDRAVDLMADRAPLFFFVFFGHVEDDLVVCGNTN